VNLLPHANADFMRGVHQPDDEYRLAVYVDEPAYSETYDANNETFTGGILLTGYSVRTNADGKASMHFSDIHLDGVTLRYRYATLFNASKGNRTITAIDIGKVVGVECGVLSIYMPKEGLVEFGGAA
jgi:hypothetical protein